MSDQCFCKEEGKLEHQNACAVLRLSGVLAVIISEMPVIQFSRNSINCYFPKCSLDFQLAQKVCEINAKSNPKLPHYLQKTKYVTNRCPNKLKLLSNRSLELLESKASLRYFFLYSGHSTLVGFTWAILTNLQENCEENFEIKKTLEITLVSITQVKLTSVQENRGGRSDAARPAADALGSFFLVRFF